MNTAPPLSPRRVGFRPTMPEETSGETGARRRRRHQNEKADVRSAVSERDAARTAFDSVQTAAQSRTVEDLDQHLAPTFKRLGFDIFFGLRLDLRPDGLRRHILGGHRHLLWERHYAARNFLSIDPLVAEMLNSTEPIFWSEISQRRGKLRPEEQDVLSEAARFGMNEGFVLPLHHPGGAVTGVILAGSQIDPGNPDTRTAARLLAGAYETEARRLGLGPTCLAHTRQIRLKDRQVECLRWVAAGKSSAEIAIVLQLSRKTVDEHIDNACRIFGVNTRMQAVVRALELHLITH